jgi:hypothetical protein
MFKWITPSLAVVGDDWPEELIVDDPLQAVRWIRARHGNAALVRDEETAMKVMKALDMKPGDIVDRLHFANTGRVFNAG